MTSQDIFDDQFKNITRDENDPSKIAELVDDMLMKNEPNYTEWASRGLWDYFEMILLMIGLDPDRVPHTIFLKNSVWIRHSRFADRFRLMDSIVGTNVDMAMGPENKHNRHRVKTSPEQCAALAFDRGIALSPKLEKVFVKNLRMPTRKMLQDRVNELEQYEKRYQELREQGSDPTMNEQKTRVTDELKLALLALSMVAYDYDIDNLDSTAMKALRSDNVTGIASLLEKATRIKIAQKTINRHLKAAVKLFRGQ